MSQFNNSPNAGSWLRALIELGLRLLAWLFSPPSRPPPSRPIYMPRVTSTFTPY